MGGPHGLGPVLGSFGASTAASLDVVGWMSWPAIAQLDTMKAKNWPALLILVIIFLTIGGNILVILAVSLEKKLQNATNYFLRSLAVADMLVGILVMPVSLVNILYDYAWPLPSTLCPIWIYLDVLFSTASIMHLCAISLDRYVAIRNPIEHSRFNSRTKAMLKIAAVWTISIGISMPIPVIGLLKEDKVFVNGSCELKEERFMLVGSFVAFFIPLVIMVVTYCLTIQVLQRQATVFLYEGKNSSSQQPLQPPAPVPITQATPPAPGSTSSTSSSLTVVVPSSAQQSGLNWLKSSLAGATLPHSSTACSIIPGSEAPSQLSSPAAGGRDGGGGGSYHGGGRRGMMQAIKNEKRASKVLGVVFFLFLIMWCPFFITNVLFALCHEPCNSELMAKLLNVFVWIGYISSGVNPLVYTLFNKTYRRAFSNYLRCRYRGSSSGAGALIKPVTLNVISCPSHVVTPVLDCGKDGAVDRNSNCRNGDGSTLRSLELDETSEGLEMQTGLPEMLSVNSCYTSREHTSSV
ncbi:5-hydroxytryptamine (serotonin) receptor 2C, G protein-coupled-like 1 isoform X2 [Denticeps clupeoides]|uniref:5-hydroxytryptamine (serotonin) receptor 2C, G protein-coupled-like 1 isoform X2 n=1 Tax=Denticeps clupeoides TaxID=299321 RepID=UPI0010A442AC|nr:5-hydroxytryptamine receptor 2C-like isoform X2 [Denticeps clupeoides]